MGFRVIIMSRVVIGVVICLEEKMERLGVVVPEEVVRKGWFERARYCERLVRPPKGLRSLTEEEVYDWVEAHTGRMGDCWTWHGAMRNEKPFHDGLDVRKFILTRLGDGKVYTTKTTCGNPFCVRPAHIVKTKRSTNHFDLKTL